MTSRIRALNEELYQDFQENKKVTTSSILTKLTKLRRELRKSINENKCSWCECDIEKFRDKTSRTEYLISGLCHDCQDATFKEAN